MTKQTVTQPQADVMEAARSAAIFAVGLAAGTGCTIVSKTMFQARSTGLTGQEEDFKPPLFQAVTAPSAHLPVCNLTPSRIVADVGDVSRHVLGSASPFLL